MHRDSERRGLIADVNRQGLEESAVVGHPALPPLHALADCSLICFTHSFVHRPLSSMAVK